MCCVIQELQSARESKRGMSACKNERTSSKLEHLRRRERQEDGDRECVVWNFIRKSGRSALLCYAMLACFNHAHTHSSMHWPVQNKHIRTTFHEITMQFTFLNFTHHSFEYGLTLYWAVSQFSLCFFSGFASKMVMCTR